MMINRQGAFGCVCECGGFVYMYACMLLVSSFLPRTIRIQLQLKGLVEDTGVQRVCVCVRVRGDQKKKKTASFIGSVTSKRRDRFGEVEWPRGVPPASGNNGLVPQCSNGFSCRIKKDGGESIPIYPCRACLLFLAWFACLLACQLYTYLYVPNSRQQSTVLCIGSRLGVGIVIVESLRVVIKQAMQCTDISESAVVVHSHAIYIAL